MALRKAVFFDRDGVINVSPGDGYVLNWDAFQFSPGIFEVTKLCHDRGYALVLVTSQQGVGKGLMSQADLDVIHERMQTTLRERGAAFDVIEACTHLVGTCTCRKPSPEMIHRAAAALGLDLSRSWLIGDHDRDIQMAINADVPGTIRVVSHHEPGVAATHSVGSPAELTTLLSQVLDTTG
jgi:histidinol-phosphate phosphatase family protein